VFRIWRTLKWYESFSTSCNGPWMTINKIQNKQQNISLGKNSPRTLT
jgi:hypothetical protein